MTPAETFATVLLVLSAGALGVTILIEGSRLSVANGRRQVLKGRIARREKELQALAEKAAALEEKAGKEIERFNALNAEKARIMAVIKSMQADRIEMVHEFGDPTRGISGFVCPLTTSQSFNRIEQRHVMFAREIWRHRNIAVVWADTTDQAVAVVNRAFAERSGILPGRLSVRDAGKPEKPPGVL